MLSEIKQPYVLWIALALIAAGAFFQFDFVPMGAKAPFVFAVTVFGGLASKAAVSMKADAPNTAILMFLGALILAGATALMTDVSVFQDAVWEGVLAGLAGAGLTLLGEAQVRRQKVATEPDPATDPAGG